MPEFSVGAAEAAEHKEAETGGERLFLLGSVHAERDGDYGRETGRSRQGLADRISPPRFTPVKMPYCMAPVLKANQMRKMVRAKMRFWRWRFSRKRA